MNPIPFFDSQVIRALLVALAGLIGMVVTKLGYTFDDKFYAQLIDALLLVITTGGTVWAAWARAVKPTPPITQAGADATAEHIKQGGFARLGALGLVLMASMLLGCAALGLPVAKTFNERLASGYTTVTAVRDATGVWVDAKVQVAQTEPDPAKRTALLASIRADAQNIQDQADNARAGLDVAASLRNVDLKDANARLVSTLQILTALQTYLEGK